MKLPTPPDGYDEIFISPWGMASIILADRYGFTLHVRWTNGNSLYATIDKPTLPDLTIPSREHHELAQFLHDHWGLLCRDLSNVDDLADLFYLSR